MINLSWIILIIIGIVTIVSITLIIIFFKRDETRGKTNKILCIPSGEIMFILDSYKMAQLKEHGYIEWNKEYKMYTIQDKIKKDVY